MRVRQHDHDLNQGILAQRRMLAEITDLIDGCRDRIKRAERGERPFSAQDVADFDAAMVPVWKAFNEHALNLWVLGEYVGATMSEQAAREMHARLLREQAREIERMLWMYPGTPKSGVHGQ